MTLRTTFFVTSMMLVLVGCGGDDSASSDAESGGASSSGANAGYGANTGGSSGATGGAVPGVPSDSSGSSGSSGSAVSSSSSGSSSGSSGSQSGGQGFLTAGAWDDNLNFDFFKKYLDTTESTLAGLPSFSAAERLAANQGFLQRTAANELDISFLLDTTGSMGDELSYLQSEIDGISQTIKTKFPQTTPRFGLVLYKDKNTGDPYVTRMFDFSGIDQFRSNLVAQSVGGGGDYEEEVADGLVQNLQLSWRSGAVARMTVWVADAPHHVGEEASVKSSIATAAANGIHIYPVAASGADPRTEFTMRTAAQITGGRYLFLTDDSGIGDPHAEPHIPCYQVTKFNSALVRMVESEMTGTHIEPAAGEVIRTVGNPQNGQCVTQGSGNVTLY